jgi:immune inhibitor A
VERFTAREGMLVWYVNYAFDDNNTSEHPGFGMVLPVDARPGPVEVPGYGKVNNATTSFDATFGKLGSPATTFHLEGDPATVPASAGATTFDDAEPERYWTDANEENSVKVAGSGTRVEVLVEAHGYVDLMILKITN